MKPNTHLPKSAYLSDRHVVEELREQIQESVQDRLCERGPVRVDFFYDKRDGRFGVETYSAGRIYDLSHGDTLLDAIDAAMGLHDEPTEDMSRNPPSWVKDEDTWQEAKDQVEPYWDRYDDPWAVVAYVYKQMGGEVG